MIATSVIARHPNAIEKNSVRLSSTAPSRFHPNARAAAGRALNQPAKQSDANMTGAATYKPDSASRVGG